MNIKTQCPTCDGDGRADEPYALESVGSVEFAQLRELTETQAQIIAAKNREIATLAAEIRRLQANDKDSVKADFERAVVELDLESQKPVFDSLKSAVDWIKAQTAPAQQEQ